MGFGKFVLVRRVAKNEDHPLRAMTPVSYLRQGRLWLVDCGCGAQFLRPESCFLREVPVQSCGCLREYTGHVQSRSPEEKALRDQKRAGKEELLVLKAELLAAQQEFLDLKVLLQDQNTPDRTPLWNQSIQLSMRIDQLKLQIKMARLRAR